jgi:uncharacterized protein (TIGR02145 family)
VNDSGISLTRGGPGGGGTLERWSTLATNTIKNTNVLVFAPVFSEFYTAADFQYVMNILQNSGLNLNVTVEKDSACSASVVSQFGNYGLVIMDTHGAPNGFLIGTLLPDTLMSDETRTQLIINVNMGTMGYEMFQAGQAMLARGLNILYSAPTKKKIQTPIEYYFRVVLTGKFIQSIPNVSGTVIFGNMCYSGQSTPATHGPPLTVQTAFTGLNPISYYGYAYTGGGASRVSNEFAKQMEDSLLTQLITNTDSTGHCYVQQNGTEYSDSAGLAIGFSNQNLYFKHWGANTWSYMKCGDTMVDARDGQKYATVCIGNQTWMAQNLNYNAAGSLLYNNDPANGPIYGRLYNWKTVMQGAAPSTANPSGVQGVCPKGWHVPSPAEYATLVAALGGNAVAGGAMKTTSYWLSPNTGASNSSGFSGTPAGQSEGPNSIVNVGAICNLWNTYQDTANPSPNGDLWGGLYQLYYSSAAATPGENYQDWNYSCRCVKDP